jgi:2-methylisocitrate lyase-like PEP mutase family enzyme
MSKAKLLRDLINAPDILVMPGIFDGFSARLSQVSGFHAGFMTGSGVSESSIGWTDRGVMGMEENLRVCRAMAGCCDLPLLADADTGYGNAVNVHFTVRAFEQAGMAGIMIEDQTWPKRCGHMKGKEVVSREEASAKLRAAAEARRDKDMIIMSRTDTLATDGIDEVVVRLNLYSEAGADLLFADALLSPEHIARVVKEVPGPVCVNMGFGITRRETTALLSPRQLQELGVAAVIYPRLLTSAAIQGMKNAIGALTEAMETGTVRERPELQIGFEELNALVGSEEVDRLEAQFLTPEQYKARYGRATYERVG